MHRHAKLSLMTLHIFFYPKPNGAKSFLLLVFTICDLKYVIISRGLYNLYLHLEGKDIYLWGFFHKILALTTVSFQERFIKKSKLEWVMMARVR